MLFVCHASCFSIWELGYPKTSPSASSVRVSLDYSDLHHFSVRRPLWLIYGLSSRESTLSHISLLSHFSDLNLVRYRVVISINLVPSLDGGLTGSPSLCAAFYFPCSFCFDRKHTAPSVSVGRQSSYDASQEMTATEPRWNSTGSTSHD